LASGCIGAASNARWRAKKTKQSGLTVSVADAVGAYEKLRAAVLNAAPSTYSGLCIIRRRGLAAWIRECGPEPHAEAGRSDHRPSITHDLSPAARDLTRLLAGIIVALTTEPAHARG
jgi:hypothetical protein